MISRKKRRPTSPGSSSERQVRAHCRGAGRRPRTAAAGGVDVQGAARIPLGLLRLGPRRALSPGGTPGQDRGARQGGLHPGPRNLRGAAGPRRPDHSDDPEVASVSLDLVRNLMQENDLHACQPRAYKVTTISGAAPTPAIADHVKRDFTATAPGTRLVGDITYVRT